MTKVSVYLIFCGIFSVIMISACSEKKTDEELIQEQITRLQEAIETQDRRQFMAIIDSEYSDQINSDRQSLQRMLLVFFLRYKNISVYVSATQINIQKIRADARSQVILTGGKHLIPDNARHYQLHSCWKKVSDEWFLSCLEWQS